VTDTHDTEAPTRRRPRAPLKQYLRLALGVALLALLVSWVDLGRLWSELRRVDARLVAAALVVSVGLELLSAVKLHLLVRARATPISIAQTTRLYFVSGFFSSFLPTSVGGDAVKAGALARPMGSLAAAGTAVALERASGVAGLWIAAASVALARPRALTPFGMDGLRWPFLAATVAAPVLLALAAPALRRARPSPTDEARPGAIRRFLRQVAESLCAYGRQPVLLGVALALSVAFHLLRVAMIGLLALGLDAPLPVAPMVWAIAIVTLVSFVPVSLGALGLREGATTYCLVALGMAAPEALAVALLARCLTTAKALAGGVMYALGPATSARRSGAGADETAPPPPERPRRGPDRTHAAVLAGAVAVVLLLFTGGEVQGQNELSRLVAVDSLVLDGEFHIDGNPWTQLLLVRDGHLTHALIDMVYNRRDGHFYSSKPPVYTMLLAALPALARMFGIDFAFTQPTSPLALTLLRWVVVGWLTCAAFHVFRSHVGRALEPRRADVVTILTLGATLFLSYSTTVNHHTFAAGLILMAFLALGMPDGAGSVPRGRAALAGFLLGLASVIDIGPGFVFSLATGFYLLCYVRSARTLLFFALGSVAPLGLHAVVQYGIWGSVLPVQMVGGTKNYQFSYWLHRVGPDAWRIPRSRYWFLTLFSMHGLFVLTPVLLVGAARLVADVADALRVQRRSARAAWRPFARPVAGTGSGYAAAGVLFAICFLVAYYSLKPVTHFGGTCFGMRWYIGFTPVLALYAARGYASWRGRGWFRVLFHALGLVSLVYAAVALPAPWAQMEEIAHPAVRVLHAVRGF
jgi:uncharacterized membrane protein YbhN (UPF0104 family)